MKKIAIIMGNISLSAGTERAVTNLANILVKYGEYEVTIFSCFSASNLSPCFELNKDVKVIHLDLKFSSKLKKVISYIKIIKKINSFIRTNSYDVLLGTTHAYNCLLCLVKNTVKKIACEHMSYNACPRFSRLLRRIAYKKLDAVVVLTKADSKNYKFIKSTKLHIIPNSLSFVCSKPSTLSNKRIIAVGRLTKQKGFDMLIDIAFLLKKRIPEWKIDIFGDGEDKVKLINKIDEKKLNGFVSIKSPTKNIKKELLESSVYVMTSRWEGLPMILLEAKACGLPIVSFDCPEGPADVIKNGEDGYLVSLQEIIEFTDKVTVLCNNSNLRRDMGKQSFTNSFEFSDLKVFEKWNSLFREL